MVNPRTIVDFKANPAYVLPSLLAIDRFEGDWHRMRMELIRSIRALDSDASEEVIVSAYVTPTLRNLLLADGVKDFLRLLPDGQQCLRAYYDRELPGYLSRLGLQLVNVDALNAELIPFLLANHDSPEKAVTASELATELHARGYGDLKKSTRLRGWIDFLTYVSLLRSRAGRLYLVRTQYEVFKNGERRPTVKEFTEGLKKSYAVARRHTYGSPYVTIPDLREATCKELKITTFTFDEYLKKLATVQRPVRIVLATPTEKVAGGLMWRGKYYYLLALYHDR